MALHWVELQEVAHEHLHQNVAEWVLQYLLKVEAENGSATVESASADASQ